MDEAPPLKLRLTPTARAQTAEFLSYLARQSPQARDDLEIHLQSAFDLLATFPLLGTGTSQAGVRRSVLTSRPYVIFYRITATALVVVGVRHTSRRPLHGPSP